MSVASTWKKMLATADLPLPGERQLLNYVCSAKGCATNFGDPERRTSISTNFISWTCWVFEHHEKAHGRSGKWIYDHLNTLVIARWL